ncbi:MAG: type II toxin-antitoxin system VapC family toxin [Candidatus Korobacteraceae bacterium]|jgi:predicted nucleic acid-binding protein
MSRYLLDTNVISEYSRPWPPDVRVKTWVDAQNEDTLHLSVLTFGEIRKGVTLLPAGKKRDQLEQWLEGDLSARFAGRLLPINDAIAEIWGAMAGQAQLKGITLAIIDGLMAATAKHHGLTVVTRNVKDFSVWGIPVTNPWRTTGNPV